MECRHPRSTPLEQFLSHHVARRARSSTMRPICSSSRSTRHRAALFPGIHAHAPLTPQEAFGPYTMNFAMPARTMVCRSSTIAMAARINVCRDCSLISLRPVARSVAGPLSLILVRDLHSLYFLRPMQSGIGTLRTRLARGAVIPARRMCRRAKVRDTTKPESPRILRVLVLSPYRTRW